MKTASFSMDGVNLRHVTDHRFWLLCSAIPQSPVSQMSQTHAGNNTPSTPRLGVAISWVKKKKKSIPLFTLTLNKHAMNRLIRGEFVRWLIFRNKAYTVTSYQTFFDLLLFPFRLRSLTRRKPRTLRKWSRQNARKTSASGTRETSVWCGNKHRVSSNNNNNNNNFCFEGWGEQIMSDVSS